MLNQWPVIDDLINRDCDEASVKTQMTGLECFQVGEHREVLGERLVPFPQALHLFHLAVPDYIPL